MVIAWSVYCARFLLFYECLLLVPLFILVDRLATRKYHSGVQSIGCDAKASAYTQCTPPSQEERIKKETRRTPKTKHTHEFIYTFRQKFIRNTWLWIVAVDCVYLVQHTKVRYRCQHSYAWTGQNNEVCTLYLPHSSTFSVVVGRRRRRRRRAIQYVYVEILLLFCSFGIALFVFLSFISFRDSVRFAHSGLCCLWNSGTQRTDDTVTQRDFTIKVFSLCLRWLVAIPQSTITYLVTYTSVWKRSVFQLTEN